MIEHAAIARRRGMMKLINNDEVKMIGRNLSEAPLSREGLNGSEDGAASAVGSLSVHSSSPQLWVDSSKRIKCLRKDFLTMCDEKAA